MTKEQRTSLEVSIMSRNDMMNSFRETLEEEKEKAIKEGREIGLEQGREEGREQGREEERRDNIKKLLAAGVSAEVIADALNLTLDQIREYSE